MANPTAYTRYEDYSDFQSNNPNTDLVGASLDIDYDRIKTSLDSVIAAIEDVRRSDGALVNSIVTADSLSSEVLTLMGNWTPRGTWVTATSYAVNDVVRDSGIAYVCLTAHTSGTFATDLAANKWMQLGASLTTAADVTFVPAGSLASTDVQAAIEEVSGDVTSLTTTVSGKQASDATLTALAAVTTAADKLIYATGADAFATTDFTAAARALLDDANAAAMLVTLGAVGAASPTFTTKITISSTDAGASSAPTLDLFRDSASPAAADNLGVIVFSGNDDGAAYQSYGYISAYLVDPTAGSEDALISIGTTIAGTSATRMYVQNGVVVGSPTGSDEGAGTINATKYFENGQSITPIAWADYDYPAGVPTLTDGYNVSGFIDNGTGDTTIQFTNAAANANYTPVAMACCVGGGAAYIIGYKVGGTKNTSGVELLSKDHAASATDIHSFVVVFGDK